MKKELKRCILILGVLSLFLALSFLAIQVSRVNADEAPVASFVYSPSIPTPGEAILFDASSSYAPAGSIVAYTWDFGDGYVASVTTPTITHSYPIDGTYTVQLIVTDNSGLTGVATAVVQVNCVVFFRSCQIYTLIPMSEVEVTAYTNKSGTWEKAPVSSSAFEIMYDNMTQPNLATTSAQRYRNPGYTASILRSNASNIGFDAHQSSWYVYFTFKWREWTAKWPNDTTRVYTYKNGAVEAHDYLPSHGAVWNAASSTYVVQVNDIHGQGVAPTQNHPIIVTLSCPLPPQQYYLTVRTDPTGITTITGQGWYGNGTNAVLTAPTYVNISSNTRYRFNNWDVDGTSQGATNPIIVVMNANHTATAHYVLQYYLVVSSLYDSPVPVSGWFNSGMSITSSVTSPVPGGSGTQYVCTGWSGTGSVPASGATSSVTFTITQGSNITWNWKTQYYLSVSSVYGVTGGQGWYDSGGTSFATVTPLTVAGPSGTQYVFTQWSGGASGTTSPSNAIAMNGPKTANANWKTQYYLTVVTNPSGVDSPSGAGWYDPGTNATISTDAFVDIVPGSSRYRFNGWTTPDMTEISDPTRSPTNVSMDAAKTVTANYVAQYKVTFDQTGVGSDFTTTIVTIDLVNYNRTQLSVTFWLDNATSHDFAFQSPLVVTVSGKQYVWTSTAGMSTSQSGTLTVYSSGSVTGNYKTQYYFASSSPYNSPTPANGWFDDGASITASVASSVPGPTGTQYTCTGWTGTGIVPGSGTGSSVSFTIAQSTSIAWDWKTQYYLMIRTDPAGISFPSGSGWYDESASVTITAPTVPGYTFQYWDVDGASQGTGVPTITVPMGPPHTAIAHYQGSPSPPPSTVGGYSISLAKRPPLSYFGVYAALIVASVLTLAIRKRKRK